ncbi:hypothetical protein BGZ65_000023, partial [Modicella reniformis]
SRPRSGSEARRVGRYPAPLWTGHVEVVLSNIESERHFEYSGLQVNFVKIRPFNAENEGKGSELPNKHIVKRAAKAIYDDGEEAEAPSYWTLEPSTISRDIPITRLAWSKDSSFLAALAVKKSSVHITVWDMNSIKSIPETGGKSVLPPIYATADFPANSGDESTPDKVFSNLSIGLAISPKGDQ